MANNEIQRFAFGTIASPVAAEDGTFTLTYSAQTTSAIAFNDNDAAITAALEALSNIGVGDVDVSTASGVTTIEFQGSLANTNVAQITASSSLKQDASDISVSNAQNGAADTAVTPSNNTTTSAVSPVDEVQAINTNNSAGFVDLEGQTVLLTGVSDDSAAIQTACDAAFGSGNTAVTGSGTPYTITFQGALAATPMNLIAVTNDMSAPGGVNAGTTTEGVAGVHQVDICTFTGGTATGGDMTFDGQSLNYAADASTLTLSGATASGTPASGTITTTRTGYDMAMAFSVAANTLVVVGQPQIVEVSTTETPTEGTFNVTLNSVTSSDGNHNDNSPPVITGWTGGGSAGFWNYARDVNATNVSASAAEGATPLRKAMGMETDTQTQGVGGSFQAAWARGSNAMIQGAA